MGTKVVDRASPIPRVVLDVRGREVVRAAEVETTTGETVDVGTRLVELVVGDRVGLAVTDGDKKGTEVGAVVCELPDPFVVSRL